MDSIALLKQKYLGNILCSTTNMCTNSRSVGFGLLSKCHTVVITCTICLYMPTLIIIHYFLWLLFSLLLPIQPFLQWTVLLDTSASTSLTAKVRASSTIPFWDVFCSIVFTHAGNTCFMSLYGFYTQTLQFPTLCTYPAPFSLLSFLPIHTIDPTFHLISDD